MGRKQTQATPEYTYTIKRGARVKEEEAPVVAHALREIMEQHGGKITALNVLEAASDEDHPLHQYFDWDDASAARRYRLQQARQLIQAVQYKVKSGTIEVNTPAFIRIFNSDQLPEASPGPGYVPMPVAVEIRDYREQVLARALADLNSWKARYRTLSLTIVELRPIIEAIGVAEGVLEKRLEVKGS